MKETSNSPQGSVNGDAGAASGPEIKLLILTGMSGSGKHTAFVSLEDFGCSCTDNLPAELLSDYVRLKQEQGITWAAAGIDIRSGSHLDEFEDALSKLKQMGIPYEILFLDAEDEVLLKRFKETRRNHPLSGNERIAAGIEKERKELAPVREIADYVVDTTHMLTRDLRRQLEMIFVDKKGFKSLYVTVMSFGFKYGIPKDADLVFDVRFLPNPFYDLSLRPLTGNDQAIRDFVFKYEEADTFVEKTTDLIRFLIPNYIAEGKNSLVICVGCTGGKHRSVTLANALFEDLKDGENFGLKIEHRDIEKDRMRGK